MTGAFLFVKPSGPSGNPGTAYSGDTPSYSYDHASWEWLLERTLRRMLFLWQFMESSLRSSRALLYGHEDKYSMHRWGAYGESHYDAGVTPQYVYEDAGRPGTSGRKTDADLSSDDREAPLPYTWLHQTNYQANLPSYGYSQVTYGISDLEYEVSRLPLSVFGASIDWLPPGWSPSDLNAWDLTASTTETTQGSLQKSDNGGYTWEWKTTVFHSPYEKIPDDPPFKCLSHMRTDDPTVRVIIKNDDDEQITVETARTPRSYPRTANGGSITDYHGTQMREASRAMSGPNFDEFRILYRDGLDYGESTGSTAYSRGKKTTESKETIGCLVDLPNKDPKILLVSGTSKWAEFVHEIDWDGKPTWWHANGFPKGLNSVLSPRLREQLKALCPVCQPAIPPAIPAFNERFPDARSLSWDYYASHDMYRQSWMQHLALACTPSDMSARLDAMTTTVHEVPSFFVEFKTVTTYSSSYKKTTETITKSKKDDGDSGGDSDGDDTIKVETWKEHTYSKEVTVEGTSLEPLPTGDIPTASKSTAGGVEYLHGTDSNAVKKTDISWSNRTESTWEESFKSNINRLVCLSGYTHTRTKLSTKTTTKTEETERSSEDPEPYHSTEEQSDGKLPDPDNRDPDPNELFFPDWILPWIETAELFASIESYLFRKQTADYTQSEYHYTPNTVETPEGETPEEEEEEEEEINRYSGSGHGTRTHNVHRKIISLGKMNTSTGEFSKFDATMILSEVDPESDGAIRSAILKEASNDSIRLTYKDYDSETTETTDKNGNYTKEITTKVKHNVLDERSRSISYYVVIKWKFDRTDPETLATELPLADLYKVLVDAKKALSDKKRELEDAAKSALATAKSDLQRAKSDLARAKEQQYGVEEAQAAVDEATSRVEEWTRKVKKANDVIPRLETAVKAFEQMLGDRYVKESELYIAERTLSEEKRVLEDAKSYLDRVEESSSVDDEIVKKAREAVEKANSKVKEWERKVKEAEDAISSLEAAIEATKREIRDAIEAAEKVANDAEDDTP